MMKPERLVDGIIGLTNLASAAGTPAADQVWSLLVSALAIVDREMPMGTPREEWLAVCAHVYDQVRGALAKGPES